MGKKLVKSTKLVGGKTKRKTFPTEKARLKSALEELRPHYSKPVRLRSDPEADYDKDYWVRQIYRPEDASENPLMSRWNRAEHLISVGYDFGKPILVVMSPQEFLDLNPSPYISGTEPGALSKQKLKDIRAEMTSGNWEPRNMTNEGPFMDIGKDGRIETHEGRHRAIVLRDMGVKEMPVLIYDRRLRDEDWRDHEPWMKDEVQRVRDRRRMEQDRAEKRRRLGME